MEFLSVYNYRRPYRRGRKNANAGFLFRLRLPPTVEAILGSSVITDPDDLGFYLIRASGYIMPFFPIPGVGLGGLVPSPKPITGTGSNSLFPLPIPVLGGLPLTNDDFRTRRPPMPNLHMTGHTTRPFVAPIEEPRLSYAINDQRMTPLGLIVLDERNVKR